MRTPDAVTATALQLRTYSADAVDAAFAGLADPGAPAVVTDLSSAPLSAIVAEVMRRIEGRTGKAVKLLVTVGDQLDAIAQSDTHLEQSLGAEGAAAVRAAVDKLTNDEAADVAGWRAQIDAVDFDEV